MSEIQKLEINNGPIDWSDFLDVFVITNGRGSFPYALDLIKRQKGIKFNLYILRDFKWINACNICMNHSNLSYYARVDDDMLLNQYTFLFFNHLIKNKMSKDAIMYHVKLWEPWNHRLANKVKVYNRNLTKKIGFETDSRGKVDKIFNAKRKEKGYKYIGDKKSFVGLHAACSAKDNKKYTKLFGWTKGRDFLIRQKEIVHLDSVLKKYSLPKQSEMANKDLIESNKKVNSNFFKFVNKVKG